MNTHLLIWRSGCKLRGVGKGLTALRDHQRLCVFRLQTSAIICLHELAGFARQRWTLTRSAPGGLKVSAIREGRVAKPHEHG